MAKRQNLTAKWLPHVAGGLLGLIIAFFAVLALIDWNAMRGPVANYLGARLNREVRITCNLDVNLFSWTPRAVVEGLTIGQPHWAMDTEPLASLPRLDMALDLKRFFGGDIVLSELTLRDPDLRLLRRKDGTANWDFTASDEKDNQPSSFPAIEHFSITDGKLLVIDEERTLRFTGVMTTTETSNRETGNFRLTGKGELNKQPFSADVTGDPLINIDPDQPYAFRSDIRKGDTRVLANGSVTRPFDLSGLVVSLKLTGPNLEELYDLTGIVFPSTRPYDLSGRLTRKGTSWRFEQIAGTVGKSDLEGVMTVDMSKDRPYVTANLSSRVLDFVDLGPLIGSVPVQQSGDKTPQKPVQAVSDNRVLPDGPLQVERLRQMDADVKYRATAISSEDFPLRGAELTLSLKNGVLRLSEVRFRFQQGVLSGTIQIDATRDVPETSIDVRMTGLKLEQFAGTAQDKANPAIEGVAVARARLRGAGDTIRKAAASADGSAMVVVPRGNIRRAFAELLGINVASALGLLLTGDESHTELRCAVADFEAKDGVFQLRQFVFDTDVVLGTGSGSVDLRKESLDIEIAGEPKKPELFRLRAPITINGTLGNPVIGVKPGAAALQGGLAAALGALLAPLAAILPFIDAGLADDADCGALLREARQKGTPQTTQAVNPSAAGTRR
jgi:uncharacterized protein involved in outer membrane biogenesis